MEDYSITFIQGDSFSCLVNITTGEEEATIDTVTFSSKTFDLKKKLEKQENNYFVLTLTPDETTNLKPCLADYDLTIKFTDGTVQTVVYKQSIKVLPKTNAI